MAKDDIISAKAGIRCVCELGNKGNKYKFRQVSDLHLLRGQMCSCQLLTEIFKLCSVAQGLVGVNVGRYDKSKMKTPQRKLDLW